ncbi:MAG: hypothetical protein K0R06_2942 [Clostridium sp.]|jgi:8-oxo-dGTP pyrophosphatase MutT (NUDIX family)|nr:hypothetical protein [Clostridium sp.]
MDAALREAGEETGLDNLVDSWEVFTDNHTFKLFWTPIDSLPEIVTHQDQWVDFVRNKLNYSFGE